MSTLSVTERALRSMLLDTDPPLLPEVSERRQRAMRRLVQNTLRGAIARALPHTRRLTPPESFDALVSRFLAEAPPTTRILREVPREFVRFLASLPIDALPHPSCAELAHWEVLEVEVLFAPDDTAAPLTNDALRADPSARLCAYLHDVTQVDEHRSSWPAPSAEPVLLLCFRAAGRVRWRKLSGACARVLASVGEGAAVTDALDALPAALHTSVDDELRALALGGALRLS